MTNNQKEKIDILKAVGAKVIICPTNVDPDDPKSYYSTAERIGGETKNSWYVNQYNNLSNREAHYLSTGPEIWEQTEGKITHFVVGVGTGGTISGVAKFLKEKNSNIKIWIKLTHMDQLSKSITKQEFSIKMRFILISLKVLVRISSQKM